MSSGIKVTIAYGDNEQVAEVPAGKPLTVTVEFAGKKAEVGVARKEPSRHGWTGCLGLFSRQRTYRVRSGSEVRNTTSS